MNSGNKFIMRQSSFYQKEYFCQNCNYFYIGRGYACKWCSKSLCRYCYECANTSDSPYIYCHEHFISAQMLLKINCE